MTLFHVYIVFFLVIFCPVVLSSPHLRQLMLIHAGCILLHTWTYFYCVIRLMQSWVLPHGYADYWCGWRNHDMIWKAINSILLMVWTSLSLSTIYTRILAPSFNRQFSFFIFSPYLMQVLLCMIRISVSHKFFTLRFIHNKLLLSLRLGILSPDHR